MKRIIITYMMLFISCIISSGQESRDHRFRSSHRLQTSIRQEDPDLDDKDRQEGLQIQGCAGHS